MRSVVVSLSTLAIPLVFATGCLGHDGCEGIGLSRTLPQDTTIAIGTSFKATYQEGGYCYGNRVTDADYTSRPASGWFGTDSRVVSVDSSTGVVMGVGVGDARIGNAFVAQAFGTTVHVR